METSIYDDAVKAYAKHCERNGLIFCQPDSTLSFVGRKYVTLANINGELCKYDIATKKIIPIEKG